MYRKAVTILILSVFIMISRSLASPMVLIPAGEFQMGNPFSTRGDLDKPIHTVYLDAFYIDVYEVTNSSYANFLNEYGKNVDISGHQLLFLESKYCLIEKIGNTYIPKDGYENHPAICVSWYGAAAYAQFYGKQLPTEAQWEKAARGGLVGKRYPWGDEITHDDANYEGTGGADIWDMTAPVGSFAPNNYGLYDMAGNVHEWCADRYDKYYYGISPFDNPTGPDHMLFENDDFAEVDPSDLRVRRDGSWRTVPEGLNIGARGYGQAGDIYKVPGFRCVDSVPGGSEAYKNYALDFGEVADFNYVIIGTNPVFDTDEITFEAWIKPTSLPTGTYIYEGRSTIVWNGDGAGGRDPYIFYINEFGKLESHTDFVDGSRFIYGSTILTLNTWHHVALTISSTKMELFLDGRKDGEISHNCGIAVKGHSYITLARHIHSYKNPFGGLIDEVRLWDVVKTEEEIRDNRWVGAVKGDEPGLIGYWDFNEGNGQILNDKTQNQNHGTISGALWTEDGAPELLVPITDLLALPGDTGNEIKLEWTAKQDFVSSYTIRYNTNPVTESNWDKSIDLDGEPGSEGNKETITVMMPYSGVVYYFAAKCNGDYGNISGISNSPCARSPIQLYSGWNMVAYLLSENIPIATTMASLEGKYNSVWTYRASDGSWLRSVVNAPAFLSNMEYMQPGHGYWIEVNEDCAWNYGGASVASPSTISTGKPPCIIYGKSSNGSKVSIQVDGYKAAEYTTGSEEKYKGYYVLEVPMEKGFHEGDQGELFVDNVSLNSVIKLSSFGKVIRYDLPAKLIPVSTNLLQNFPNPFNPDTWIPYQLSEDSYVTITIYNINGQIVKTMDLGFKDAGFYQSKDLAVHWDGTTNSGDHISSGIYFYNLRAGDFTATKKLIMAK